MPSQSVAVYSLSHWCVSVCPVLPLVGVPLPFCHLLFLLQLFSQVTLSGQLLGQLFFLLQLLLQLLFVTGSYQYIFVLELLLVSFLNLMYPSTCAFDLGLLSHFVCTECLVSAPLGGCTAPVLKVCLCHCNSGSRG